MKTKRYWRFAGIFLELPGAPVAEGSGFSVCILAAPPAGRPLRTIRPGVPRSGGHSEFEHSRHLVRLFEHARGKGLKEIGGWRG